MRFLIDNALSFQLAERLAEAGHDAVHLRDYNLQTAPDTVVFKLADDEERILVSADTDFGTLLANRRKSSPSVILFRRLDSYRPGYLLSLLVQSLPAVEEDLSKGCLLVIEKNRLRIRHLPLLP
jgi:predicted nuclease of predicted toxin-antitoxin system